MNKRFSLIDFLLLVIMCIPALYLGSVYSQLPATIPVHFGLQGADGYGEKSQSWLFIMIITGISFGLTIFLKYLPAIDPKKTAAISGNLIAKISAVMVIFFAALQVIIINAMNGNLFSMEKFLIPLMSVFFSLLGNLFLNIKPNYFIGIRLPWTLENEDNWRKTHRLAGKLWFSGGLLCAIISLFVPYQIAFIIFLVIVGLLTIIPIAYSFLLFKDFQKKQ